ncbi:MAG: aminoglycoside 6-adenylyltransferase, partial [Anaerolineae bacterium]|nr:aminoglycoside 6-adenylyltransferase [Anaerolineae bacterium]
MHDDLPTYERLTENFVTWAKLEPDLRAAVIIGSRARTDHPADQWSDLDILVFVADVEPYVTHGGWAEQIAPVWLNFVERTPDGAAWERRVLYAGGLDVDFALNPVAWLSAIIANGIPRDMADV